MPVTSIPKRQANPKAGPCVSSLVNLSDLALAQAQARPHALACSQRLDSGQRVSVTWRSLWSAVCTLQSAFAGLGLKRGDRLLVMAPPSIEWQVAELVAFRSGSIVVGLDPNGATDYLRETFAETEPVGLVVQDTDTLERIPHAARNRLKFVISIQGKLNRERLNHLSWQKAMNLEGSVDFENDDLSSADTEILDPESIATLVYTSGSTGKPKGIPYTHAQLLRTCELFQKTLLSEQPHTYLCWLPMHSLYQRVVNWLALSRGEPIHFLANPREIGPTLSDARPTLFIGVPRFYEKLHTALQNSLRQSKWPRLMKAAMDSGRALATLLRSGRKPALLARIRHKMYDLLVLRRLRKALGGRAQLVFCGSAPVAPWLLEFFHAIGLPILEAYGLSENAMLVAANRPQAFRFGSVGKPIPGYPVRIASDGEIMCRSWGLFQGYWKGIRPTERFDADGFFRTGDYGYLDEDGYLYIRGRKSDLIKTTSGRRISPVGIEAVYRRSPYVDQIMVVGHGRLFLTALVTLNEGPLRAMQEAGHTSSTSTSTSSASESLSPEILKVLQADFVRQGEALQRHERVGAVILLKEAFSVQTGELTATLKLKRSTIQHRYQYYIDRVYARNHAELTSNRHHAASLFHTLPASTAH